MVLSKADFDSLWAYLLTNNRNIRSVRHPLPDGYGFRLGEALQHNTEVSELYLDLRQWRVDGDNGHTDNISMILHFLRSGPSLEHVVFADGEPVYTDPCLRALSQHPTLQEFELWDNVEFSPFVLAEWVETTQTLQRLSLPTAIANNDQVAAALVANSSISHLTASNMSSSNAAFLDHIGRRTATSLDVLELQGEVLSADVVAALSRLAKSSSTMIPLLIIQHFEIGTKFSAFLRALSSRRRGPCMIAKLKLSHVQCSEASATKILARVEARINNSRNSANAAAVDATANAATLREIAFEESHWSNTRLTDVKLVTALALNARDTLERLVYHTFNRQVGDVMDRDLFWTKMEEQICTAQSRQPFQRLGEITMAYILTGDNDAMFRCLPKLTSLQTLTINHHRQEHQHSTEAIRLAAAAAIRRNGSLTRVAIEGQFQWSATATDLTMLTNRVDRIAVAALQRNEMLPKLLSRPTTLAGNQEDDGSCIEREGRYPHLFAAALPAESMTPHFVLMGLNALDNYE